MGRSAPSLGECQWDLWLPLPDKTRSVHLFPYRTCLPVGGSLGHSRPRRLFSCSQQVLCSCSSFCFLYHCTFCHRGDFCNSRVVTAEQFCALSAQDNLADDSFHRAWCPVCLEHYGCFCAREEEACL